MNKKWRQLGKNLPAPLLHARWKRLRHLGLGVGLPVQRTQGMRVIEVKEGVVAARQHGRDLVAVLFVLRAIAHADRAVAARLPHRSGRAALSTYQNLLGP